MVFQTVHHGTEAAHGKAADEGVLPLAGKWKHPTGHLHQFLTNELTVAVACLGTVHIEGIVAGGHNNAKIPFFRPPLDPGAGDPIGIIAQKAME